MYSRLYFTRFHIRLKRVIETSLKSNILLKNLNLFTGFISIFINIFYKKVDIKI